MASKEEVEGFWYNKMKTQPDAVFTVTSCNVKLRSDDTAVIMASFTLTGTRVSPAPTTPPTLSEDSGSARTEEDDQLSDLDNPPSLLSDHQDEISLTMSDQEVSLLEDSLTDDDSICSSQPVESVPAPVAPLFVTQRFSLDGVLQLHLDSHSKVSLIDFFYNFSKMKVTDLSN